MISNNNFGIKKHSNNEIVNEHMRVIKKIFRYLCVIVFIL